MTLPAPGTTTRPDAGTPSGPDTATGTTTGPDAETVHGPDTATGTTTGSDAETVHGPDTAAGTTTGSDAGGSSDADGSSPDADGTPGPEDDAATRARRGLTDDRASVRLRAAMTIGASPDETLVATLIARCAVEPDFQVREALTWALTRHSPSATLPGLLGVLRSGHARAQARSQALHTLSKIGDRRAWPAVTPALLCDADDDVARSAWRAALVLVPEGEEQGLAAVLTTQLGRGGRQTQLSLSRALTGLGEVVLPGLRAAMMGPDPGVRAHAMATERLLHDPDAGFGWAIHEAKRIVALGGSGPEG